MNGRARPFAAHDFLYRSLPSSLFALRPLAIAFSLFLCTRHVPIPVEVGCLGRSALCQDNGGLCYLPLAPKSLGGCVQACQIVRELPIGDPPPTLAQIIIQFR